MQALFDEKHGAFRYLSDYLAGSAGSYAIAAHDVNLQPDEVRRIATLPGLTMFATEVIHGSVPAVAWRVEIGDKKIAFSGDTNGNNGNLQKLAQGADIFVAHNAVPKGAQGVERTWHMPPCQEQQTLTALATAFKGETVFADDLDCYAIR